jgi:Flp pilus assembly protein protease CpaA
MLAIALFSLPIALSDWKYRRIPNIYMLFIFYWVTTTRILSGINSPAIIGVAILLCFLAVFFFGLGMGDAKFFMLLCLALNLSQTTQLMVLIFSIYLAATIGISTTWLTTRRIPDSYPMAVPIIVGATLYLAASMWLPLQQYADALVNSW